MLPTIIDKRIIIIDDYLDDPNSIRELSSKLTYNIEPDNRFSGVLSTTPVWDNNITSRLSYTIGDDLIPTRDWPNGHFVKSDNKIITDQSVHVSIGSNLAWVGYLFLTPEDEKIKSHFKDNGVKFWRHKDTGLDHAPLGPEEASENGINSFEELMKFLEGNEKVKDVWEETLSISYRYNRLVLFRPWMFRSIGTPFGEGNNTRLTFLFYLDNLYHA